MKNKSILDYPELDLNQKIKDFIIKTIIATKYVDRDSIDVRLIKEDKEKESYKLFATNKQNREKVEPKVAQYIVENKKYSYNIDSYVYTYEEASGNSKQEAIKNFFDKIIKNIISHKKIKEKEFAKTEKDLAVINYILDATNQFLDNNISFNEKDNLSEQIESIHL